MLGNPLTRLRRAPRFAAAAVLILGLGTLNAAVTLRLLDAVALRRLPVPHANELVELYWQAGRPPLPSQPEAAPGLGPSAVFPLPAYRSLEAGRPRLASWLAFAPASPFPNHTLVVAGGHSDYTNEDVVSGSYFGALGLAPAAGRLLGPTDDRDSVPAVAVVSLDIANSTFGGPRRAIGESVLIDAAEYQVVGVAPAGFAGLRRGISTGVWVPMATWAGLKPDMTMSSLGRSYGDRSGPSKAWLAIFGRLDMGADARSAATTANVLVQNVVTAGLHIAPSFATRIRVGPGGSGTIGMAVVLAPGLRLLLGIALAGFTMACGCFAVVSWARVRLRRREFAIRKALGAPARTILHQGIIENLLLVAVAVASGAAISLVISRAFAALYAGPAESLGFHLVPSGVSPLFLGLLGGMGIIAVVFGVAPLVWYVLASRVLSLCPERERPRPRSRALGGHSLLAIQIAFSLLVVAAGMTCTGAVYQISTRPMGYRPSHLLSFRLYPERQGYSAANEGSLVQELLGRIRALPGVVSAGATGDPPASSFAPAGYVWPADGTGVPQPVEVVINTVSPGYLSTLQAALLKGRDLGPSSASSRNFDAHSIVVSEATALAVSPKAGLLGRRLSFAWPPRPQTTFTVVGVVRNIEQPTGVGGRVVYGLYGSSQIFAQNARKDGIALVVRTGTGSTAQIPALRDLLHDIAPDLPAPRFATVRDRLAEINGSPLFALYMTGSLSVLTLGLAAASAWGLQNCLALEEKRSNGIRLAVGATRGRILRRAARDTALAVIAGLAAGSACVWAGGRWLHHLQFGFGNLGLLTLLPAAVLLTCAALVGAVGPLRRAATLDPAVLIREE